MWLLFAAGWGSGTAVAGFHGSHGALVGFSGVSRLPAWGSPLVPFIGCFFSSMGSLHLGVAAVERHGVLPAAHFLRESDS